jgi:hypothetical protein
MPGGRPTDYKPEYCELLIQYMSKGYSYQTFAAQVNCNVDTLYEWEKKNPEFSDAKKMGFIKSQAFWEDIGIQGLWTAPNGPNLNATVWIFNMKNRFKWRDKQPDEETQNNQTTVHVVSESKIDKLLERVIPSDSK